MDGFESARLKLDRAEQAAEKALQASDAWAESQDLSMTAATEPSDDGFDLVVRLHGVSGVPDSMVIDLDDSVHHSCSALDHAMWQLLIDARAHLEKQSFPVLRSRPHERNWRRLVDGLSDPIVQQIEAVQPFNLADPDSSLLWILHHLDIQAKHRAIVPVGAAIEGFRFDVPDAGMKKAQGFSLQTFTGLGAINAAPILRAVGVEQGYRPPDPHDWIGEFSLALWLSFTDATPSLPIRPQLRRMVANSRAIVDSLDGLR